MFILPPHITMMFNIETSEFEICHMAGGSQTEPNKDFSIFAELVQWYVRTLIMLLSHSKAGLIFHHTGKHNLLLNR